jgi:hypothetical protein|tara:strand:- start:190 stop:300 length:111 start_codon:yes stop_codon:yes gene_type:complete
MATKAALGRCWRLLLAIFVLLLITGTYQVLWRGNIG